MAQEKKSGQQNGSRRIGFIPDNQRDLGNLLKALAIIGRSHIINLQDHLNHLSSQKNLLLLAVQSFDNVLLFHVWKNDGKKI